MEQEKTSIIDDRIRLLYEGIRDEQATIFNIDWKARTLLMVNSITVPLILGIFSFYSFKTRALEQYSLQSPMVLILFVVSVLLLLNLGSVFYLTLRVIQPRIRFAEKLSYPEQLAHVRDLDIFFPVFKKETVDYGEYTKKLQGVENKETIEQILLAELLSISMIRDHKTKILERALFAMAANAGLILAGFFLFLFLLF